jgi:hypothetical protein
MIRALRQVLRLPVLLALACAGLAGIIATEVTETTVLPAPSDGVSATTPGAELEPPGAQRAYAPRPLDSYVGIGERPLFSPSRRPSPPAAVGGSGKGGHDTLMLAGVILTTSKRLAMLETKQKGGAVVVREGQIVEGWSVDAISADRVVISQNGESVELLLDDKLRAPRREVRRTPRTAKPAQPAPQPPPAAPAAEVPTPGGDGTQPDTPEETGDAG